MKLRHPEFCDSNLGGLAGQGASNLHTSISGSDYSNAQSKGNFVDRRFSSGLAGSTDAQFVLGRGAPNSIDLQSLGLKHLDSNLNSIQNVERPAESAISPNSVVASSLVSRSNKSKERTDQPAPKQRMNLKQFTVSQRYK